MTGEVFGETVRVQFDVRVRMRDGVFLSTDVYLPAHGPGPWPVLVNRTPYDNSRRPELPTYLAAHGYAVAVQDVRGRGDSDGVFVPWRQEFADGHDTVEWAAAQPWSDGLVGMYGGSYASYCGWAATRERPSALGALVSRATSGITLLGVPHDLGAAPPYWLWFFNLTAGRTLQVPLDRESPAVDWERVLATKPLREMDGAIGRESELWQRFIDFEPGDEFARQHDLADVFEDLDIPVLHITGWHDAAKWGELRTWKAMADRDKPARGGRLILGPWDHYGTGEPGRITRGRDFGDAAAVDIKQRMVRFFDAALKHTVLKDDALKDAVHQNPDGPEVEYFITGRNEWASARSWPPDGLRRAVLYLHSSGAANSAAGDGQLTGRAPERPEPPDNYVYDPENPNLSTPDLSAPFTAPRDLRCDWRLDRADVLVYTTEPLEEEIVLLGNPVATLFAGSDRVDTDFHLTLMDVSASGESVVVSGGFVRASYRSGVTKPRTLLVPGEISEFVITLGATAHAFRAGSRIRLSVASADFPDVDRNPNTGAPLGDDYVYAAATNTVHHSARFPSRIDLRVLPESGKEASAA